MSMFEKTEVSSSAYVSVILQLSPEQDDVLMLDRLRRNNGVTHVEQLAPKTFFVRAIRSTLKSIKSMDCFEIKTLGAFYAP